MRLASGTWRLQAVCPPLPCPRPPPRRGSPPPCRAWPTGSTTPSASCRASSVSAGRAGPGSSQQPPGRREGGGTGASPHGAAAGRGLLLTGGRRDGGFPSRGGGGTRPGRPGRSGKSSEGGRPLPPSPVGAGKETRCRGLRGGVRPSPAAGGPVPEPCPGSEVYLGLAGWLGGKKSENNTYWGFQEERVLAACVTDQ